MGDKPKRDAKSILATARRREATLEVCLRGDLVGEHAALDAQLQRLQQSGGWVATSVADVSPVADLAERIAALEEQMREDTVTFHFRALPTRADWDALLEAHPARPQHEERYNWATFPVAIVSASLVDPEMTIDEVAELFDILNEADRDRMFGAAWGVNQEASTVPFSQRASDVNLWRAASSKQPALGESPAASS